MLHNLKWIIFLASPKFEDLGHQWRRCSSYYDPVKQIVGYEVQRGSWIINFFEIYFFDIFLGNMWELNCKDQSVTMNHYFSGINSVRSENSGNLCIKHCNF